MNLTILLDMAADGFGDRVVVGDHVLEVAEVEVSMVIEPFCAAMAR